MKLPLKKTLRSTCFSGFLMLALAAPVHATLVHGTLDPAFGGAFPSLGWSASFDLYVPSACLTDIGTGTIQPGHFTGDCAGSGFQNVVLNFYDVSAPNTVVESFALGSYAAASNTGVYGLYDENQELFDLQVTEGVVTGFDSTASLRVNATSPIAGGGNFDFSLLISSDPSVANLFYIPVGSTDPFAVHSAYENNQDSQNQPVVNFATVPEPGTLALAGLALLGLGLGRRRRS